MQNTPISSLKLEFQERKKRKISENSIITISSDTDTQGIFTSQSSSRKVIKKKEIKKFIRASNFKSKKRSQRIKFLNNPLIKEQTEANIQRLFARLPLKKNYANQACKGVLMAFSKDNPVYQQDKITKEKHEKNLHNLENFLESMAKSPENHEKLIELLHKKKFLFFLRKCLKYGSEKVEKSEEKLRKSAIKKKEGETSKKKIENIVFTLEQIKTLRIYFENIKEVSETKTFYSKIKSSFERNVLIQGNPVENHNENLIESLENKQCNDIGNDKASNNKNKDFIEENAKESNLLEVINEKNNEESFEGTFQEKASNKNKH